MDWMVSGVIIQTEMYINLFHNSIRYAPAVFAYYIFFPDVVTLAMAAKSVYIFNL